MTLADKTKAGTRMARYTETNVEPEMTIRHTGHYRFRRPQRGFLPPSREELDLEKQQRYEEAVVKRLLKRTGRWGMRFKLWNQQKNQVDFGRLAFCDFQAETGFPMWLETRRMDLAGHSSLVNLLRNFDRTPIFDAFREIWHASPARVEGCPVGLVFPAPRIKYMVLHTWASDLRPGATRIAVPLDDDSVLALEELDDLLKALGPPEDWSDLQA